MTGYSYFKVLARRWVLAVIVGVLSIGVGLGMVAMADRSATVESTYFVSYAGPADATDAMRGNTFVRARIKSYVAAVTSSVLLEKVAAQVPGSGGLAALVKDVKASSPGETDIINVVVARPTADDASAVGKAITQEFPKLLGQIEGTGAASPVRVTVLKDSELRNPETNKTLLLSALIGLFLVALVPLIPVPRAQRAVAEDTSAR